MPAFPRCSGPEACPSGEPHIVARLRRTSTPCEAFFRPHPPGPAGLRRPLLGGARIVHAAPGFGKGDRAIFRRPGGIDGPGGLARWCGKNRSLSPPRCAQTAPPPILYTGSASLRERDWQTVLHPVVAIPLNIT